MVPGRARCGAQVVAVGGRSERPLLPISLRRGLCSRPSLLRSGARPPSLPRPPAISSWRGQLVVPGGARCGGAGGRRSLSPSDAPSAHVLPSSIGVDVHHRRAVQDASIVLVLSLRVAMLRLPGAFAGSPVQKGDKDMRVLVGSLVCWAGTSRCDKSVGDLLCAVATLSIVLLSSTYIVSVKIKGPARLDASMSFLSNVGSEYLDIGKFEKPVV